MLVEGDPGLALVPKSESVHCVVLYLAVLLRAIVCMFSEEVAVNVGSQHQVA